MFYFLNKTNKIFKIKTQDVSIIFFYLAYTYLYIN